MIDARLKIGATVAGLGCFLAAYFFPGQADTLIEAGVGVLLLTGVAHRVSRKAPPRG